MGSSVFWGFPFFPPVLQFQGDLWAVTWLALLPVGGSILLWISSAGLARKAFRHPSHEIPFDLTSEDIPSLASFVVGLLLLAEAAPQGANSWTRSKRVMSWIS